jgi:energy-coupling factor transport system ATP-binding protein
LCGKSGSGRTTLLRHLKSVLTPCGHRDGEILFNGSPIEQVDLQEQSAKIGYVMQNPDDQIVTDKVWHELAFGLESLGCDQKTMRARVSEMACYFGIQDWFHRDVDLLSGGQKQLLNLASIMAMQPEVLILDLS